MEEEFGHVPEDMGHARAARGTCRCGTVVVLQLLKVGLPFSTVALQWHYCSCRKSTEKGVIFYGPYKLYGKSFVTTSSHILSLAFSHILK